MPEGCDEAALRAAGLPLDLAIVPPKETVPARLAAFSGVWCGLDAGAGKIVVLAVERVTPTSAHGVYAYESMLGTFRGSVWRFEGRLADGTLVARPIPGMVLTATVRPDDLLELQYGLESVAGTFSLTRVPFPADEPSREFDGTYATRFEVEAFREGPDCADDGEAVWLEAERTSGFYEAIRAYRAAHPQEFPNAPFGRYRVRFTGRLSPPGHYGHVGAYLRRVTVEKVLDVASC